MAEKKKITILGSTGSIGKNTLDIIAANPDKFDIVALSAGSNVNLLLEQAKLFKPKLIAIANSGKSKILKDALKNTKIEIVSGNMAAVEAASLHTDVTISAIVGFAGLKPTMRAIENSKIIALANKECLVCAGSYMMNKIKQFKAELLPLDSEHNAIFQVFDSSKLENIVRIILTASGGPFLKKTRDELKNITPKQAITHPNWSMGAKISVDSATMMNKALEIIEAHHLFNMSSDKIDVLIHPQSTIHSMVEYIDGSLLAQLGAPDMRTPIAYTLAWPNRMNTTGSKLDISNYMNLEFYPPNTKRFPLLKLVREVIDEGKILPVVFNAAGEVAVYEFLQGNISFLDIENIIFDMVEHASNIKFKVNEFEDIFPIDEEIRIITLEKIKKHATNIGYS